MNFADHFAHAPVLLVVIHAFDCEQIKRNASVAFEAGADGIFLIAGKMDWEELAQSYQALRVDFPDAWIGLNFLDLDPHEAFQEAPAGVSGLWVDNAETDEILAAQAIQQFREARPELLYFGGVAFKYQRKIADVGRAASAALPFVDLVTTSGEGTGYAPDVAKIAAMKESIGAEPLAIASGITPENVADYLGICDCFLVATGISHSIAELDPERVSSLASIIRQAR